ncbi:hypothetical protein J6590_045320 [Homalodisca vitripennis]|nr:hypothetical protein J6590_045320 [Homalodisca vitripennis]
MKQWSLASTKNRTVTVLPRGNTSNSTFLFRHTLSPHGPSLHTPTSGTLQDEDPFSSASPVISGWQDSRQQFLCRQLNLNGELAVSQRTPLAGRVHLSGSINRITDDRPAEGWRTRRQGRHRSAGEHSPVPPPPPVILLSPHSTNLVYRRRSP